MMTKDNNAIAECRQKAVERLKGVKNKDLINKSENKIARISDKGIGKMTSGAAINKSKNNGFTAKEHFCAVMNIVKLWRNAKLVARYKAEHNLIINRFVAQGKTDTGKAYDALLTVKETVTAENCLRLYSLELDEANKASQRWAVNQDEPLPSHGKAPTGSPWRRVYHNVR